MGFAERLSLFSPLDALAVGLILISWFVLGWHIEHPGAKRPSVTVLMADYRREWMKELVTREPRIFDAQVLSNLRQGTSFFASACMIAIGGVFALLSNADQIALVARDLTAENAPAVIWQAKLLLVVVFLTHGFLKFVWANRLFGYCAVMMAAVPNDIAHPEAYGRAAQAAEMNIRAAWNFNRGLRAIYFALGALAWLLGAAALIVITCVVSYMIWSREFYSRPRDILLERADIEAT